MALRAPGFAINILKALGLRRAPLAGRYNRAPSHPTARINANPSQIRSLRSSELLSLPSHAIESLDGPAMAVPFFEYSAKSEIDLPCSTDEGVPPQLLDEVISNQYVGLQPFAGMDLLSTLAFGGLGVVYRGMYAQKRVAVKISGEAFEEPHSREARTNERLSQYGFPGIPEQFLSGNGPEIIIAGTKKTTFFTCSQMIDGKTLLRVISEHRKPLNLPQALEIAFLIHFVLSGPANLDILHRDIKPENIMIDKDGNIHVIDWSNSEKINDGNIFGTPGFVAPESYDLATDLDERVDIYAIGVILHTILARKYPEIKGDFYDRNSVPKEPLSEIAGVPSLVMDFIHKEANYDKGLRPETHLSAMEEILCIANELAKTQQEFTYFQQRVEKLTGIRLHSPSPPN
ncbi:MAG: protein kinase [Candidatus Margulisiibacteriota bacterium]